MKVSFPHMGYLTIAITNMLNNLGIEVITAPPISKKTIEIGSLHSPEGVCLPYKINMGNFIESIEHGADTLVTICGAGKCRMGFYNAVQKIALTDKSLKFHTINTNHLFSELYHFLYAAAKKNHSRLSIIKNIALAVHTLKALDTINDAKNHYGPRSDAPAQIISLFHSGVQQIADCHNFSQINRTKDMAIELMKSMADCDRQPPRIALIGEFYVLMEPSANHEIENKLVEQGIEVKKFVQTGEWAYSKMLLQTLGLYSEETDCITKARPYLHYHVGGDGLKSVASALKCAKNQYNGIIHIYPFSCMPEIVAQYSLKNIAADYHIPMLTFSLDEHSSDVGMVTRIEAFADCIKRKYSKSCQ